MLQCLWSSFTFIFFSIVYFLKFSLFLLVASISMLLTVYNDELDILQGSVSLGVSNSWFILNFAVSKWTETSKIRPLSIASVEFLFLIFHIHQVSWSGVCFYSYFIIFVVVLRRTIILFAWKCFKFFKIWTIRNTFSTLSLKLSRLLAVEIGTYQLRCRLLINNLQMVSVFHSNSIYFVSSTSFPFGVQT